MDTFKYISNSEQETGLFARKLAGLLKPGSILCLHGDLGAGKTTFTKGLAEGLKIKPEKVHSPTFTLLNIYEGKVPLYHFDLYRMDDIKEILNIGYEEFLYGDGIAVIEWADKLKELLPPEFLKIEFKHEGEDKRSIAVSAQGKTYDPVAAKFVVPRWV